MKFKYVSFDHLLIFQQRTSGIDVETVLGLSWIGSWTRRKLAKYKVIFHEALPGFPTLSFKIVWESGTR